ncbi:unnamed protein product [Brassicogethes aeneus]|uniref:acid phosphatase n=1 Tax=Brassicogethes aeneus TaxID=1431903 RepID=A0A9P0BE40_BRAAE|nr:unnamed protein product [Brassicogethes aeneus]
MISYIQNFFSSLYDLFNGEKCSNNSLRLVQVIFRHGNRTNLTSATYKIDPYRFEQYYPYGVGQLTKEGKLKSYKMGQDLRKRYKQFLGDVYLNKMVEGISSSKTRAQCSLLAALAGLCPPNKNEIFEKRLNWQPIPYNTLCEQQDKLFLKTDNEKFVKLYCELQKNPETMEILSRYCNIFSYLTDYTGQEIKTIKDSYFLYGCFKVEEELGFVLPDWSCKVYPDPLHEMALIFFTELTENLEIKRLFTGYLMKFMVNEMNEKITDRQNNRKKMVLYSAHDLQVMCFLIAIGYCNIEIPPYAAYILVELHEIDNVFGVKVFYQNYKSSKPCQVKIKGKTFTPLDEFVCMIKDSFPKD